MIWFMQTLFPRTFTYTPSVQAEQYFSISCYFKPRMITISYILVITNEQYMCSCNHPCIKIASQNGHTNGPVASFGIGMQAKLIDIKHDRWTIVGQIFIRKKMGSNTIPKWCVGHCQIFSTKIQYKMYIPNMCIVCSLRNFMSAIMNTTL